MKWIPTLGETDVWEVPSDPQWEQKRIVFWKKIMTDAGWPGDGERGGWRRNDADFTTSQSKQLGVVWK